MPDPYWFVRSLTIGLATIWTVGGLLRLLRLAATWRSRLVPLGLSDHWLRRQVAVFALRTTVLDPINLALMLTLLLIWSLRLQVE